MNDSWHDNGNIWRPNRPEMGGDPHSYYQSSKRKKKSHNSYIPYEDRPRDKEPTENKNVLIRRTNKNYDSDAFASFEEQIEAKKQEHMKQTELEQNQLQESLHNQLNRQRQYLEEKDHIFSTKLNDHKNPQSSTVLPYNDSSLTNNRHSKFSQSVQRAATQGCAFLSSDAVNATSHTSPTNAGISGNLTRILQRPSNGDNTVVMTGPTTNESHVNSHPYNGFRNLAATSLTQPLTNTNTPAILKEFEKLSLQDNNNSGVAKKHVQISLEKKDNNEIGANENDMKLMARATKSWADLDEMASSEDNQSDKGDRDVNNQNHDINDSEHRSLQFHKDENGKNDEEEGYENDKDQYDDQDYEDIQENEFQEQEHKNYNSQHVFTTQDVRSGDLKKKGRGFQGQYRSGNSATPYQSRRNRERNNTNRHTDGRGTMTRDRGSYDYNSYENQYDEYYDHYGYNDYNTGNAKHDNGHYRYRKPRKEHSHNVDNAEYSTFNVGDRRNGREPRYSEHKHYSSTNPNQFQNRNRERYQNRGRRRRGGGDDHTNTSTGLYTSTYENEMSNRARGKRSGYSYTQHKNLGY